MTGRWKCAAGALAAMGALALSGTSAWAWDTPSTQYPDSGSTLVITSDGAVNTDWTTMPMPLGLPGGVAAAGVQPEFQVADGSAAQQWIFTPTYWDSTHYYISPRLAPGLCLTNVGNSQQAVEQVLVEHCALADNQSWNYLSGNIWTDPKYVFDTGQDNFLDQLTDDTNGLVDETPFATIPAQQFETFPPTLAGSDTITLPADQDRAVVQESCPTPYLAAGADRNEVAFDPTNAKNGLTVKVSGNTGQFSILYSKTTPVAITGGVTWTCVIDADYKN